VRRTFLLLCAVILVVGLISGCQPSEQAQQLDDFDHEIHAMQDGFAAFYLLGPTASVSSVQSATNRLSATWRQAEGLVEGLEDIDISHASAAHDALVEAVTELPEDAEQGEAMQTIMPLVETFEAEIEEIHESGHFHE